MNQTSRANTLNEIVNRLVARFDPDGIILGGTHIHGAAHRNGVE